MGSIAVPPFGLLKDGYPYWAFHQWTGLAYSADLRASGCSFVLFLCRSCALHLGVARSMDVLRLGISRGAGRKQARRSGDIAAKQANIFAVADGRELFLR